MSTAHPQSRCQRAPLFAKGLIWTTLALALTLQPGSGIQAKTPDDEAIAVGVRQAFANHPALGDERITVVVHNGVVELSGYVDSRYDQAAADTIASGVEGVQAVDNLLKAEETPSPVTVEPPSELKTDAAEPIAPSRPKP